MRLKKRILAVLVTLAMLVGMIPMQVFADTTAITITSADQLPTEIAAGTVYELGADITLASGQQITTLAGVLDGKGHTITLADKPLANNVSGTIQNLGVLGSQTLTLNKNEGSIGISLSGTIQNSYSLVDVTNSGYDEIGGLVGLLTGGSIYNCYYGGNNSAMFGGGLAGTGNNGYTIKNSCAIKEMFGPVASTSGTVTKENIVEKEAAADMKTTATVEVLNTSLVSTGYKWTLPSGGGFPVLVEDTGEVDKSGLETAIASAKQLVGSDYTSDTWAAVQSALTTAETVLAQDDATQTEVNNAAKALETAMGALVKPLPTKPVAAPDDTTKIVHITNQTELEKIGAGDKDKYYVLDNDIALDGWYGFLLTSEFNGVLDGKGHTITFNGDYYGLFKTIGINGVVQNVHFAGKLKDSATYGAAAAEVKGAVINCYSEISGTSAGGIATRLNGGVISNCYSISGAGKGPVIAYTTAPNGTEYTGTLINVYWQKDLIHSSELDWNKLTVSGGGALSASVMKTLDFVAALNENKGTNGVSWGQSSNGYPYFGANQEYNPDDAFELTENKTAIAFTPERGGDAVIIENQELTIDRNTAVNQIVGTFSLPEYTVPEGGSIEWSISQQEPANTAMIGATAGNLSVEKDGVVVVVATLVKADSSTEVLASAKITTYVREFEDIKLYLADSDGKNAVEIEDGKATVDGSESKQIVVKAKYKDESIYQTISTGEFSFDLVDTANVVKHTENSSAFSFTAPGTAAMTVTYNNDAQFTKSVELTSEYVAVESVEPAIKGTIVLHERNGNTSEAPFVTDKSGVNVTPANASYSGTVTITSSDTSIAQYVDSMAKGYVAYKAGTVTYTATINDDGNEVSGTSEVTYVYKNPLTSVTVEKDEITLKNGEKVSAGLIFTGTLTDGHEITETGMTWEFDKEDIISIVRGTGGIREDEGAPDRGGYFLSKEYTIKALKEGTVTVTGTPVDTTGGAQPITFTVTVTANSNLEEADIWKIISDGIATSNTYLQNDMKNSPVGMIYGYEWHIISLLRAGQEIDENLLDEYYDAVVEEIKIWDGSEKPTDIERVALAMAIMGKDITDVSGVNLAEMIYNSDDLADGSNELAYALLALDALDTEIPTSAKWNRDTMVEEILKFQNTATGGFGLYGTDETSIDMTAMCVQALAPYKEDADVAAAIKLALDYLRNTMSGDYDFGDANATAQVLLTLAVLDMDVTDPENGFGTIYENIITQLDEYRYTDGNGFKYLLGDSKANNMATIQVMQAFDAYKKMHKEDISYWDFTAVGDTNPDGGNDDDDDNNGNPGNTAADPIDVNVTISDAGEVVVMQQPVEAKDCNSDGKIDVDEVLYAAHEAYYNGGAAAGYASVVTSYGLSIAKLWGDESGAFGYWLNNGSCWSLGDVVKDGDYLTAFVYKDGTGWSDTYSCFGSNNYTATVNSTVNATVEKAGYDANWNTVFSGAEGVTITAYEDGKVVNASVYTVADKGAGEYEVTFAEAGTYYLVATNAKENLVPAVCKVVCTGQSVTPTPTPTPGASGTGNSTTNNNTTGSAVNTGDHAPIISMMAVMLFAGMAICVVLKKRTT